MSIRPVLVFGMAAHGHFQRLLPIVSGLAASGVPTYVFTHTDFRGDVERAGGRFVDLFAGRSLAEADDTSTPVPCRYVTFAGRHGDRVAAEAAALDPGLVVHDTFAVIGPVVAHHLGVPRVNVCAGHNAAPARSLAALEHDPRVRIAPECWNAVRLLRERHGLPDASPFSYLSTMSPDLNLYCEPPELLRPDERAPFEPLAFLGSLSPELRAGAPQTGPAFSSASGDLRVYVSFGTVVWWYYAADALRALEAISGALTDLGASALVSLGGTAVSAADRARIARPGVRVETYVDQWRVLEEATLFITHNGLNSTHEAIFHGTPMLSYPFFADQPGLARRCQELGLADPLGAAPRAAVSPAEARAAVTGALAVRETRRRRLAEAREWELSTIAARPRIIAQLRALAGG